MQQTLLNFFSSLGIELSADALLVIVSLVTATVVWVLAGSIARKKLELADKKFRITLESEKQQTDDQLDQLSHTFTSLSQRALQENNSAFLTLASQNFEHLKSSAEGNLKQREQSFANLVKPIEETIRATEAELKRFDTNRKVSDAKLQEQINGLLHTHRLLQAETSNLSKALRRPEVRGQWGELTLRRLVELAGMSEHCDFIEQASVSTDAGVIRPDMLINMPSNRQLIVDVKTPLDAFMSAAESDTDEQREKYLAAHARNLKKRIQELASKQYWQQFDQSPDFVILFIPGDQFLSSALQNDKALLEYALEKRILLATPTSLVGLLRAIAYGWNHEKLSENSLRLRDTGQVLYTRLNSITKHLNKLGGNLDQSVLQFNRLAGSFQHKVVPATRKLADIGIGDGQDELTDVAELKSSTSRRVPDLGLPDEPEPDDNNE